MIVTITSWISAAHPHDAHTSTIVSNTFSHQFDVVIMLSSWHYFHMQGSSQMVMSQIQYTILPPCKNKTAVIFIT